MFCLCDEMTPYHLEVISFIANNISCLDICFDINITTSVFTLFLHLFVSITVFLISSISLQLFLRSSISVLILPIHSCTHPLFSTEALSMFIIVVLNSQSAIYKIPAMFVSGSDACSVSSNCVGFCFCFHL